MAEEFDCPWDRVVSDPYASVVEWRGDVPHIIAKLPPRIEGGPTASVLYDVVGITGRTLRLRRR